MFAPESASSCDAESPGAAVPSSASEPPTTMAVRACPPCQVYRPFGHASQTAKVTAPRTLIATTAIPFAPSHRTAPLADVRASVSDEDRSDADPSPPAPPAMVPTTALTRFRRCSSVGPSRRAFRTSAARSLCVARGAVIARPPPQRSHEGGREASFWRGEGANTR